MEDTPPDRQPQAYRMSFPTVTGPREFLVEGCRGRAVTRTEMRLNFMQIHVRDTAIILEEGNLPHPR